MTGESNTPSNPAYNAASSAGTASLGQQYPDIEERKIRLAERLPKFSILHVIITGLAGLSGALAVAFISAKKDLEYQEREHRHKIIEQATQGVSPQEGAQRLLFFVEAGILSDDTGEIRRMAESDPVLDLSNLTQPNNHTTSDDGLAILKRFIALDLSKKLLDDGTHLVGYNHWVLDDYVNLTNGEVLDLSRDRITQDEADALLKHDLVVVEKAVNSHVMVPLSQGQFDALVSFVANVGPVAFGQSDVLQAINRGQLGDVPGLLRAMTVVDNIPVQTLKQRRAFEVRLWNRKL